MPNPILTADHVSKSFGALKAVHQVSFAVNQGEIFGIAGPNGSGKSTLFNLLTSIPYRADSGSVKFEGRSIERLAPHQIARMGMVRTFQKDAEFETLTAYENVRMGAVFAGGHSDSALIEQVLDQVHFDPARRQRKVRELSVFDKKKLMIASALASKPRLLLMDEPASGLTRLEVEELDALIRHINASGVTVLLIEHVLSLLLNVSQRLMVLNYGQVLAQGKPDEVARNPEVIEAYLGKRGRS